MIGLIGAAIDSRNLTITFLVLTITAFLFVTYIAKMFLLLELIANILFFEALYNATPNIVVLGLNGSTGGNVVAVNVVRRNRQNIETGNALASPPTSAQTIPTVPNQEILLNPMVPPSCPPAYSEY